MKHVMVKAMSTVVGEHQFSQLVPTNWLLVLDRMKVLKDALAEHAALSRVFFGFVLGFTIPFLLAR